jgi:hypothetical protein
MPLTARLLILSLIRGAAGLQSPASADRATDPVAIVGAALMTSLRT